MALAVRALQRARALGSHIGQRIRERKLPDESFRGIQESDQYDQLPVPRDDG
jgi:hypothetical protein